MITLFTYYYYIYTGSLAFGRVFKTKKESLGIYLVRWFEYIQSLNASILAVETIQNSQKKKQEKSTKVHINYIYMYNRIYPWSCRHFIY